MNIQEEYQRDNHFLEDEKLYYILTGEGGAAMLSKSQKYYVISCKLVDCLEKCLIYGHIRRFAD